jgi:hypothetical protein
MFDDDQFTKYVNARFPAIDDSQRRKAKEAARPTARFVLLAPVEPNSDKTANQTAPPFSEAA